MSTGTRGRADHELLDAAEDALDAGEPEQAIALCEAVLREDREHPGAWFVRGDALRMLERHAEARESFRRAALAVPQHGASWGAYARACFDSLAFDEARRAVSRALEVAPDLAEAWWVRGALHEWDGRGEDARRAFLHAAWLDDDGFPLPHALDDAQIEAAVDEALGGFPPELQSVVAEVPVLVEDLPDADLLRSYDPPASPHALLGVFAGPTVQEQRGTGPWGGTPPTITLFRRNLERIAEDPAHLVEELRVTLLHEIGHYLGLDEDDVADRGLE